MSAALRGQKREQGGQTKVEDVHRAREENVIVNGVLCYYFPR